jgi:mxaA protein
MKQIFLGWLAVCLIAMPAFAETQVSAQPAGVKVLSVQNPATYAGIQLGDILQRTIKLAVSAQDQLNENNLPLKGLQRHGIELRQLQVNSAPQAGKKVFTLVFEYQVFASAGKPVQLQLPAEHIVFNSGAVAEIPAWRFWLMSQLPDRLQPAKPTVIAQYHPLLKPTEGIQRWLAVSLLLAVAGSLVLLYRNADWRWLPMMNGNFARAYHTLKRLPATSEGQKQATLVIQQAFNERFGQQMLASHVPAFVAQQPVFQPLESQIQAFLRRQMQCCMAVRYRRRLGICSNARHLHASYVTVNGGCDALVTPLVFAVTPCSSGSFLVKKPACPNLFLAGDGA